MRGSTDVRHARTGGYNETVTAIGCANPMALQRTGVPQRRIEPLEPAAISAHSLRAGH